MGDSNLEAQLKFQLRVAGITGWQSEYRFHPTRRWRGDVCFPNADPPVLVELQGGLWGGDGRHSRMSGYTNDSRKMAEAQLLGWRVLYVTPMMLDNAVGHEVSEAITLIERALGLRRATVHDRETSR